MLNFRRALAVGAFVALALSSRTTKAQWGEQIQMSQTQIERFIPAFVEVIAIQKKMILGDISWNDKKAKADISKIVKNHGLKNLAEYSLLVANITFVLNFVDPKTKKFLDKRGELQARIAQVTADPSLASEDKQKELASLNREMDVYPLIRFPSNVDLVIQYYDKLMETGAF